MIKPPPPKPTGIAGLATVFCVSALVVGLGVDLMTLPSTPIYNVAAQPGGRAVLGIGVATVMVLVARAMRFALRRRGKAESGEGGDALDHA